MLLPSWAAPGTPDLLAAGGRVHTKEQLAHPASSKLDPSMQGLPAGPSLDDLIPSHLRAYIGPSSRGSRVPVIRNGGSNTLNFQFHDPAPRTVCNGYAPPRRDGSQHPDPAWYQTWPGPGSRPSASPKQPASQHAQNWSATWSKDNKRRDKRWVKYEGIGPVDESGMPIAPRSVSPGLGVTERGGPETLLSSLSMTIIGVSIEGETHTLCV
nr:vinexin-like isoform X2 [Peromyscus maniculatus bairdii]